MLLRDVMLRYCCVILRCVTSCYAMLHCVTLRNVMLCYITLCYVMSHCAMLCYVMLYLVALDLASALQNVQFIVDKSAELSAVQRCVHCTGRRGVVWGRNLGVVWVRLGKGF